MDRVEMIKDGVDTTYSYTQKYCVPFIFNLFFCEFLSFHVCKFPEKPENLETFIADFTLHVIIL